MSFKMSLFLLTSFPKSFILVLLIYKLHHVLLQVMHFCIFYALESKKSPL